MQLNVKQIDERIRKLQEIRRIAADPEMVAMLFEFMAADEERHEPLPAIKAETVGSPGPTDPEINQLLKGSDAQGTGLWSRKRA
jgi:hypothetical protein